MDVPKGLEEYVNDYKIHVIEVAWLTDEQVKKFRSDFGIVANFFVQKRKNQDYRTDDPREIKHVDEVLKLLSVMTGDKEYETILYNNQESGEVKNMCSVAQRLIREGREEGIQQGIQVLVSVLRKVGKTDEEILQLIMEEFKLEREKVLQYL